MARPIIEKTLKKYILENVKNILDAADIAESVTLTINVNKKSVPTVSYKINGFPLIVKHEDDVNAD